MARKFKSYEDLRRDGVLTSEGSCLQYYLDVELLRPHQLCDTCNSYMELKICSPRSFNDGYCWSCPQAEHFRSVRHGSILHKREISLSNFLNLLWIFCNRLTACDAARILSMPPELVRSLYRTLRQCMTDDLIQNGATVRIGGDGHMDLALCERMWSKRFKLTRSDISVRKSFNFEIPELMKRTFG